MQVQFSPNTSYFAKVCSVITTVFVTQSLLTWMTFIVGGCSTTLFIQWLVTDDPKITDYPGLYPLE